MVYTAALPFGHGVSVLSEEGSVVEMIGRFFFQHKPPEMSSARRGSVDSYDETENSPCKLRLFNLCTFLLLTGLSGINSENIYCLNCIYKAFISWC